MIKRIIFTIVLSVAIFIAPWWAVFLLALLGIFFFDAYYEAIVLGAFFDIIYGASARFSLDYGIAGLVTMTAVFFLMRRIKQEIR